MQNPDLDESLFRTEVPQLTLPEGFEQPERIIPGYREGFQVLTDFCSDCYRKPGCPMNFYTRQAMGENYPFWPNNFVPVRGPREEEGE
tara:strand:- start:7287 stop:7550 length:264 start_codon:yes stop_codon:yes gene_type:complete